MHTIFVVAFSSVLILLTSCNGTTDSGAIVPVRYTLDVRDGVGNGIDSVSVRLITADEIEYVVFTTNGGKAMFSPITSYHNQFFLYKAGYISEVFSDNVYDTDSTAQVVIKIIDQIMSKEIVDTTTVQ